MTASWMRSLCLGLLALVLCAPMALGQAEASANDLRREVDELRQRVAQLQAQVAEKNRQIKQLEDEIKQLKASGATPAAPGTQPATPQGKPPATGTPSTPATQAPGTQAPPANTAAVPTEPLAAPEALFNSLAKDYQDALGTLPQDSDADRRRYHREVTNWARNTERKVRGDINWLITITDIYEEHGQSTIDFHTLDPVSGLPYSTAKSQIVVPTRTIKALLDKPDQRVWKLTGKLIAKPTFNAERADAGMFDSPKLIGPYAEFGMDVNIQTLTPAVAPTAKP